MRGGQWRVKSSDEDDPVQGQQGVGGARADPVHHPLPQTPQPLQGVPPVTPPAGPPVTPPAGLPVTPRSQATHKSNKNEDPNKRHQGGGDKSRDRKGRDPRDEGRRRNASKSSEVDTSKSQVDLEKKKLDDEKKRKDEEDQKRKEEEIKKQEQEKKQKEEEVRKEEEQKREEERQKQEAEQQQRQEEARRKQIEQKRQLRQDNIAVQLLPSEKRSDPSFLKCLDANVKRNTAFIKKLKSLSHDNAESICSELLQLNLSRYVTEAVTNIAEANIKPTDVDAAVKVCSLFHQRYVEFSPNLIPTLAKYFSKPTQQETEQEKNARYAKRRTTLKFLTELLIVGVCTDPSVLLSILKSAVSEDKDYAKDKEYAFHILSLIVSFVRHAEEELLGVKKRKSRTGDTSEQEGDTKPDEALMAVTVATPQHPIITADQQSVFLKVLEGYYHLMEAHLVSEHTVLKEKERDNHTALLTKGEISDAASSSYDHLRKFYEKLHSSVLSLSGLLGQEMPVLPEDQNTTRILTNDPIAAKVLNKDEVRESIWDDEDTRSFYENLPDLALFVPKILLTDSGHKEEVKEEKDKDKEGKEESDTKEKLDEKEKENENEKEKEKEKENEKENEKEKEKEKEKDKEEEENKGEDSKHLASGTSGIDGVIQKLPTCVNRDLIDQLAISICYINTKANRKKLVKAMFNVSRTQLVLLPYYARLTAILSQYMKDVGTTLVAMLDEEFNYLFNKKDQMNIETKVKNIRFLGELVKFKICPTNQIFSYLKMCLDDFAHHNIDVACNLLETCGRYLYRTPETHIRVQNMMETLMRLKNVKNLDSRQDTMVENAYYQCKPPEKSARAKSKENKDPVYSYTKHLIYIQLNKNSAKVVLKQLRKLPWDKMEDYIESCLRKVHKGKFGNIHLVASIISGLAAYYDTLSVKLVDALLEDIRVGLEKNDFTMHQRRVMQVKLLGELYNYCIFESGVIFDCLYSFLSLGHPNGVAAPVPSLADDEENKSGTSHHAAHGQYGHGHGHVTTTNNANTNAMTPTNPATTSARGVAIDPPTDCFRIRLACVLLDTCGQFFDRGPSKKKLDDFLLYFQRYILSKSQLPVDVEFMISDTFEALRPKLVRLQNYDLCQEEIQKLEGQAQGGTGIVAGTSSSAAISQIPRLSSVPPSPKKKDKDEDRESDTDTDGDAESDDEDEGDDQGGAGDGDGDDASDSSDDDDDDDDPIDTPSTPKKDDDDSVTFGRNVKFRKATTVQDDEFDRELNKFIHEGMEAQRKVKAQRTLELKLPMSLISQTKSSEEKNEDLAKQETRPSEQEEEISSNNNNSSSSSNNIASMKFAVLLRPKGKKEQIRNIDVPVDSTFARKTQVKKEEEKQEQQVLKRIVLQYEQQAEEEYIEEDFPELTIRKDRPQRGGSNAGYGGSLGGFRGRGAVRGGLPQRGRGYYVAQQALHSGALPITHPQNQANHDGQASRR